MFIWWGVAIKTLPRHSHLPPIVSSISLPVLFLLFFNLHYTILEQMGNCQAIDNASFVVQHPNGKVESFYCPVSANEIMKMNPGHYVALLLTTTMYSSTGGGATGASGTNNSTNPLRITRIKLLRPTDTLVLGHVYRLVTYQEVMKGLWAKKQAKMKQQQETYSAEKHGKIMADIAADIEAVIGKNDFHNIKQVKKQERHHRSGSNVNTNNTSGNSAVFKSRGWQPSLKSISEAGS